MDEPQRPPSTGARPGEEQVRISAYGSNTNETSLPCHGSVHFPQNEGVKPVLQVFLPSQMQHQSPSNNADEEQDSPNALFPASERADIQPLLQWQADNPQPQQPKLLSATAPRSTGEVKTRFQHLCDEHRATPSFDYQEVAPQSFLATLDVHGRHFESSVPQPSKKLARDEVCKIALTQMRPTDKMAGVESAGQKAKKRKSENAGLEQPVRKSDKSEDWITLIHQHCAKSKRGDPKWDDAMLEGHQRFVSALTIPERPQDSFRSEIFGTKKDAKADAAKAAVTWLRNEGLLNAPAEKRRRESGDESTTGIAGTGDDLTKGKSIREQVHQLVATLGFQQPRMVAKPSTLPSDQSPGAGGRFYDCHAVFDERDTLMEETLRGPLGQVKNCSGQGKAKEACCERVLPILEEIKRKRLTSL